MQLTLKALKEIVEDAIEYYGDEAPVKIFNEHGEEVVLPTGFCWGNVCDQPQCLEL